MKFRGRGLSPLKGLNNTVSLMFSFHELVNLDKKITFTTTFTNIHTFSFL